MADTEFKDLTAMTGTDLADGDSLLVLDATGNVTKRILVSEIIASTAEAEAGTEAQRFMTPERVTEWAAANVNGGTIVSVKTASASASVDFTASDLDTTNYDFWEFHLLGVDAATDDVILNARISTSATFNTGASDYTFISTGAEVGDTLSNSSSAASAISMTDDAATNGVGTGTGEHGVSGKVGLYNLKSSSVRTRLSFGLTYKTASATLAFMSGAGEYLTTEANDGIQFLFSSGNVNGGTIVAVGYKTS